MKSALILLAVCSFTAAMVPRERRAIAEDEVVPPPPTSSTSTTPRKPEICAPVTPCGWTTTYVSPSKIDYIPNTFCECGAGTTCQSNDDDFNGGSTNAVSHFCRPESDDNQEEKAES